ncbi:hypothetical protein ABK040_010036 [Willaertia magna]
MKRINNSDVLLQQEEEQLIINVLQEIKKRKINLFINLPLEIISIIIQFLSLKEIFCNIYLCKQWYIFFNSNAYFWKEIFNKLYSNNNEMLNQQLLDWKDCKDYSLKKANHYKLQIINKDKLFIKELLLDKRFQSFEQIKIKTLKFLDNLFILSLQNLNHSIYHRGITERHIFEINNLKGIFYFNFNFIYFYLNGKLKNDDLLDILNVKVIFI